MRRIQYLLPLLLISACDLVVDIDVPFDKKQLVVNCYFNPDSVWKADISLNKHILDTLEHSRVENALVIIYENDLPIDTLSHQKFGGYKSDSGKPLPGKTYRIQVAAKNYDPVSAHSYVPVPVLKTSLEASADLENDYKTKITVRFQDNGTEKNFYQIKAYVHYLSLNRDLSIREGLSPIQFSIDNPAEQAIVGDWNEGVFFNDVLFNGNEKELTLTTHYGTAGFIAEVRSISEDLYRYETTRSLQQSIDGNPLAQPINVYSNIQNGFGIFAGYASSTSAYGADDGPPMAILSASATQVRPGDKVIITVENLPAQQPREYLMAVMSGDDYAIHQYATRKTDTTVEFIVSEFANSGKIAIKYRDLVAVSDFEIEVIK
jgi:hypothetical protein